MVEAANNPGMVAIRVDIPEAKSQATAELCRLLDLRDHMRDQLEDINARIDACLLRNQGHEMHVRNETQAGDNPLPRAPGPR